MYNYPSSYMLYACDCIVVVPYFYFTTSKIECLYFTFFTK